MTILAPLFLLVGVAFAHSGLNAIIIDGISYPPFDSRVDNLLGPVRRIEWSHDVILTPFNPVGSLNSPGLACQPNAKVPSLKAVARAGAEVTFQWTKLVKMHHGPVIAYLGSLPTAETKPQDVKFFKIFESGFDASQNKWGNEIVADNNNTFTAQIPSDIKAGTYVLRTELVALHGNMKGFSVPGLNGPEYYPYCFNVEVTGNGVETPAGVTFPGAYKATDYGLAFNPYYGNGSGLEQDSKYLPPGPPLYKGKFDKPTGPLPVVQETGAYSGQLDNMYKTLVAKLNIAENKVIDYVNNRWPAANTFDGFFDTVMNLNVERAALANEIEAVRALAQSTVAKRFVA